MKSGHLWYMARRSPQARVRFLRQARPYLPPRCGWCGAPPGVECNEFLPHGEAAAYDVSVGLYG